MDREEGKREGLGAERLPRAGRAPDWAPDLVRDLGWLSKNLEYQVEKH